jgi:hypothetical protein
MFIRITAKPLLLTLKGVKVMMQKKINNCMI